MAAFLVGSIFIAIIATIVMLLVRNQVKNQKSHATKR